MQSVNVKSSKLTRGVGRRTTCRAPTRVAASGNGANNEIPAAWPGTAALPEGYTKRTTPKVRRHIQIHKRERERERERERVTAGDRVSECISLGKNEPSSENQYQNSK